MQICNLVYYFLKFNLLFQIPDATYTGVQCSQKWKNLLRAFKKYIDNTKATGAHPLPKPPYFDFLYGLLKGSQSISPSFLFESGSTMVCNEPSAITFTAAIFMWKSFLRCFFVIFFKPYILPTGWFF